MSSFPGLRPALVARPSPRLAIGKRGPHLSGGGIDRQAWHEFTAGIRADRLYGIRQDPVQWHTTDRPSDTHRADRAVETLSGRYA